MKDTSHTPGPWRFAEGSQARGEMSSIYSGEEFRVAYVITEHQRAIDIANARLIAAAPEILDALKLAVGEIEWHEREAGLVLRGMGSHNLKLAKAAIAKATGQ